MKDVVEPTTRQKIIRRLRALPIGQRGQEGGGCCNSACVDCELWQHLYELKNLPAEK